MQPARFGPVFVLLYVAGYMLVTMGLLTGSHCKVFMLGYLHHVESIYVYKSNLWNKVKDGRRRWSLDPGSTRWLRDAIAIIQAGKSKPWVCLPADAERLRNFQCNSCSLCVSECTNSGEINLSAGGKKAAVQFWRMSEVDITMKAPSLCCLTVWLPRHMNFPSCGSQELHILMHYEVCNMLYKQIPYVTYIAS